MRYIIYTDATADLSDEMLRGLPYLEMIPMEIEIEGKTCRYGRNEELTCEFFYSELRSGKFATTSQTNPEVYTEYFEKALSKGWDILYLCFTSGLSGTINAARISIEELKQKYPDRRIECLDTLCASVGEGFFVVEALERQEEGFTLNEMIRWAEEYKHQVCHWFTVDNFEHLKHGGRVSAVAAAIGSALNIKPLLNVSEDGKLAVKDKSRGYKSAVKAQLRKFKESWMPEIGKRVIIGHADEPYRALTMAAILHEDYPEAEIDITEIGPVIGSHVGPGMVALIYWGSNR